MGILEVSRLFSADRPAGQMNRIQCRQRFRGPYCSPGILPKEYPPKLVHIMLVSERREGGNS